jgi:exodeoxyribonuclease V gamma subunit
MNIYVSNTLEILARHLVGILDELLSSVLAIENIVVQSAGMQKRLSLELARHQGVCANYDFPFPNAIIDRIFHALVPKYRNDLSYNTDVLVWKIMGLLPLLCADPDFQPVFKYLQGETTCHNIRKS